MLSVILPGSVSSVRYNYYDANVLFYNYLCGGYCGPDTNISLQIKGSDHNLLDSKSCSKINKVVLHSNIFSTLIYDSVMNFTFLFDNNLNCDYLSKSTIKKIYFSHCTFTRFDENKLQQIIGCGKEVEIIGCEFLNANFSPDDKYRARIMSLLI
jgi:hypothetical protein